ncbi:hypothetical protein GA0116948_103146 [Chitinophaga costaii]|uniref:Uncharacterized protein n=1 Tax=Chitinophaga costaii TaxID=1335309 RepID=A0A1C4BKV9_9BACT|nr:hypothetical protein [Chitinophaga costaii]PUZ27569.1 hypothetical protein DCM91_04915 [Chitinophaga costaii]SCC07453.1 hypothetical protein GA0116948_103146 [Chitinophaga costaii]
MKGRLLVLTILFTLFTGVCMVASVLMWQHKEALAGEAASFIRMALLLFVFFLIPTIILWIKLLKP